MLSALAAFFGVALSCLKLTAMSAESTPASGLRRSMSEWTNLLAEAGFKAVASQVDQGRFQAMQNVEKLGLPHNRWTVLPVNMFLEAPQQHAADFEATRCFTILASEQAHTRRYRQRGLDANGVVDLIKKSLSPEQQSTYKVIIEDSPTYLYGGNIVCDKSGNVRLEMSSGQYGQSVVVGGETPQFVSSRDAFTQTFKHQFEDEAVRRIAWNTILSIPHYTDDTHAAEYAPRGITFHPGYYEFYITDEKKPVFIDYSDKPAFIDLPHVVVY